MSGAGPGETSNSVLKTWQKMSSDVYTIVQGLMEDCFPGFNVGLF